MTASVLVLRHEAATGPAAFERLLDSWDVAHRIVETLDEEPPEGPFDGALVLGGSLGAGDERLAGVRSWIRKAVSEKTPLLGVCLGGQLLARALGGSVGRALVPELGMHDVFLTEAGSRDWLLAPLAPRFRAFGWHEDSFAPPRGAVALAGSALSPYQAFRVGQTAYGLQFHPEVRADDLARWRDVPAYARLGERASVDWEAVRVALARERAALDRLAETVLGRWLTLVRESALRRRGPTAPARAVRAAA